MNPDELAEARQRMAALSRGAEPEPFDLSTWEGRIDYWAGHGLSPEEIEDAFDKVYGSAGAAPTRSGEMLDWGLLHGRRRIQPLIPGAASGDADWDMIVRAWVTWTQRKGNEGQAMPKDEMIVEARMGRDRIDAALRRHGVTDYRYLRSRIGRRA